MDGDQIDRREGRVSSRLSFASSWLVLGGTPEHCPCSGLFSQLLQSSLLCQPALLLPLTNQLIQEISFNMCQL